MKMITLHSLSLFRALSFAKHVSYVRLLSTLSATNTDIRTTEILGKKYDTDNWTNVTPQIISKVGANLHVSPYHPLSHMRKKIVNYFYQRFLNRVGNPTFSVYDNLNPVVTIDQNFDSLLVPNNHPSRNKNDCYYINKKTLLRAHTTAHQAELVSSGLDNFLVIGDVYRRDEIDSVHYPVFHQVDGLRLRTGEEIFENVKNASDLKLFESNGNETSEKQACHTLDSTKIMEYELKNTLSGLTTSIFGKDIKYRWVEQYFPFTHPSWELEIFYNDKWLEILGCGITRQEILYNVGVNDKIGWAFGLGLERLAMLLYNIPDIRIFWSKDTGFLNQFKTDNSDVKLEYKPVSIYPQCTNDLSFWLPKDESYSSNDFYDIVRDVAADTVEQILLIDEFVHPKHQRKSHCYKIIYRHMERTLTKAEVNRIHDRIRDAVRKKLNVELR